MIGIVVTGHGNFASGLTSSVKLIAGEPENYEAVDFLPTDSSEDLEAKLKAAFEKLSGCTEGILVFTDLTGGSPFKISAELSMTLKGPKIAVVSGTNLGMLIEANMSRTFTDASVDDFADQIVETGKSLPIHYVYQDPVHEEPEDGEGI
ncbi:PTS sugar transporter subunit IIA [Galactobacillus timonensis]|jgi:PTS system N-acetylgalactosamine-specific IIA component|uniref:PTS sugar transporter subunit IIA n=1 Tax=Galactobacillus timonensis TaxID=2041840 RepID=UPI00240A99CA|nr:PTS sugar transporter subunit IIA [Galactobacillus timonensis]MDD5851651.1 PTS sugar transporter subunit IIA [Galactobacillus timonensis]MDD6370872.1 PTS sugar transporter subunit IIA [Galactobacillus timonensis]